MVIETSPPGGGPSPHIHRNEDETVIVLEGEYEVLFNEQWQLLRAGELAFLPRSFIHTFRNAGRETGKVALSFYPWDLKSSSPSWLRGLTRATQASELFKPVPATV